jgi:hypothetical protein
MRRLSDPEVGVKDAPSAIWRQSDAPSKSNQRYPIPSEEILKRTISGSRPPGPSACRRARQQPRMPEPSRISEDGSGVGATTGGRVLHELLRFRVWPPSGGAVVGIETSNADSNAELSNQLPIKTRRIPPAAAFLPGVQADRTVLNMSDRLLNVVVVEAHVVCNRSTGVTRPQKAHSRDAAGNALSGLLAAPESSVQPIWMWSR